MSATSIRFDCDHCGRQLQAAPEAAGRRVRCPRCGGRTDVRPYREPARPAGMRIGWPWLAGAGALIVLAAVSGVVVGAMTRSTPSTALVAKAEPKAADSPKPSTPAKPPALPTTPPSGGSSPVPPPPPPPAKVSEWKLSNPTVRTATRVEAGFGGVMRPDDGYELFEVFCDIDCPGPARTTGFDFTQVVLVMARTGTEPVRRVALGFSLGDEGPEKTSYTTPTGISVAKAGDSVGISRDKSGVAVDLFPRVTGDQTGPIRVAPKQNPTRLGFVFSAPKGATPAEFHLGEAVIALGSSAPPPSGELLPGARGPQFEKVGEPPAGAEFAQVYMTAERFKPAPNPLPQTFPSGTKSLNVVVVLKRSPPDGTGVRREIHGKDGPIPLKGFVLITSVNRVTGAFEMPLGCEPKSGPFPDGDYQTRVFLNDKLVGVLNWSVGGAAGKADSRGGKAATSAAPWEVREPVLAALTGSYEVPKIEIQKQFGHSRYQVEPRAGSRLVRLDCQLTARIEQPGAIDALAARRKAVIATIDNPVFRSLLGDGTVTAADRRKLTGKYRLLDIERFDLRGPGGEVFKPVWCIAPEAQVTTIYSRGGDSDIWEHATTQGPDALPAAGRLAIRTNACRQLKTAGSFAGLAEVGKSVTVSVLYEIPTSVDLEALQFIAEAGEAVAVTGPK